MATKKKGNGHGGPRPNSGRPTGELTKIRQDWEAEFAKLGKPDFGDMYRSLQQLAMGAYQEKEIEDGRVIVYRVLPDFKSLAYYFDRLCGKPKQAVTLDPASVDMLAAVGLTNQAAVEYVEPDDFE